MRPITGITILGFRLGVIALAVYWSALFLGTHLPAGIDVGPQVSDKLKHFGGYFGLAVLCCYVTQSPANDPRRSAWRFLGVIVVLAAYACIDELTQAFSPGRHPDVLDALADLAGIMTAVGLYVVSRQIARRFSSLPASKEAVSNEAADA
ncbi:VanZ like family protein [Stieleria maiorica]|uniref:VanZ like family protein n=1 Tax=Stieleria maiorica TaxID=2795974 RepID=A0A5B9MER5_9BACT|nr:VanZ family protein [Stieleria maiorica]QEF98074.1 VanZ like family protein [Stieleria maiorica]